MPPQLAMAAGGFIHGPPYGIGLPLPISSSSSGCPSSPSSSSSPPTTSNQQRSFNNTMHDGPSNDGRRQQRGPQMQQQRDRRGPPRGGPPMHFFGPPPPPPFPFFDHFPFPPPPPPPPHLSSIPPPSFLVPPPFFPPPPYPGGPPDTSLPPPPPYPGHLPHPPFGLPFPPPPPHLFFPPSPPLPKGVILPHSHSNREEGSRPPSRGGSLASTDFSCGTQSDDSYDTSPDEDSFHRYVTPSQGERSFLVHLRPLAHRNAPTPFHSAHFEEADYDMFKSILTGGDSEVNETDIMDRFIVELMKHKM